MEFFSNCILSLFAIASVLFQRAACLSVKAEGSKTNVGGNATFRCVLNIDTGSGEIGYTLAFLQNGKQFATEDLTRNVILVNPQSTNNRYSYANSTKTVTISNVQCEDEKPTTCVLNGAIPIQGIMDVSSESSIYVKVPPKQPNGLITTPANLTGGVVENSTVSVTCSANTGREDKGNIRWRIYRGNVPEDVPGGDQRVTLTEVDLEGDDLSCTKRYQSVLSLVSVSKSDQDLVIACFVQNNDFSATLPASCEKDGLCQQSENIKILYPVLDIEVNEPQNVFEDDAVTLTCRAEGFPLPTFGWYKGVLGENATQVSTTSKYEIPKAEIDTHDGEYFCVASNIINGQNHSISKSVPVSISVRPTTLMPEDSTTTAPTNGSTEKVKGNDGDDGTTIIIVVVVVVVVGLVIAGIAFYCWRNRRTKELIEEPPEKPHFNNRQNLAFVNSQPDLVVTDSKKASGPSPDSSFVEDGLRYADLTYDNRPRSRRPMAIGDTSSEYSDIQMPQV